MKPILVVEDKYEAIYKIAYLKCKNIPFSKQNLAIVFSEKATFTIRRAGGAGSVRGFLSMLKTDGYEDKKIIGLFDYDKEGCENFYHLKNNCENEWNDPIQGNKQSGFYRKRKLHPCFYALLLPVPNRLEEITSDITQGVFTSFVEVENLIMLETLKELKCVDEKSVLNTRYFKIKDNIKSKAFELFNDLDKSKFADFVPLFSKIDELFSK